MTELIILRGLQASGKTTWANAWVSEDRKRRARVNRDDLRVMLDNGTYVHGVTEGRVIAARDASILALLTRGVSVVSDDTNLSAKNVKDLAKLAAQVHTLHKAVTWSVLDFTDVPVDECIRRNDKRNQRDGHKLDNKVIEETWLRFLKGKKLPLPKPRQETLWGGATGPREVYIPPEGKPHALIVDVDGTVAIHAPGPDGTTRGPFDEDRVSEDAPNVPIIKLVHKLRVGRKVLFVSGRTDACSEDTATWLQENVGDVDDARLIMRKTGDGRNDAVIKAEIFNDFIRHDYQVDYVLDDRDRVVSMWRDLGLTVLQVADGPF